MTSHVRRLRSISEGIEVELVLRNHFIAQNLEDQRSFIGLSFYFELIISVSVR